MRFYNQHHRFYCGIDLHARTMHVCILDAGGTVVCDRNLPCHFETFLQAIAPFRDGIVVGVECMFGWYWLADLCAEQQIPFVLGHALYMKPSTAARPRTTASTPTRSPACSRAATSRWPMPIPRACARPATCCAGACTWSTSGPN